jgi:hypothetical protein
VVLNRPASEYIETIVSRIAPRAFRRPVDDQEIEAWTALARPVLERGGSFPDALRVVLRAMFTAPEFLYASESPGPLNDHALAARLARFLWRSLPDHELAAQARQQRLRDPRVQAVQVARLLNDPKAMRFIDDFLGQWLDLHGIDATTPDRKLYPEYDDVLRSAMLEESRLFFADLVRRDRGVRELIDAEFTFLNRRLATHYGVKGVEGLGMRKVRLPGASPRGGILTQASVLKTTANGTTTSPVLRGSFVLDRLLGHPPRPPPPDAGTIEPDTRGTTTIRETLDAHRNVERCARCHREIDPPGFALENFDAIGGFRSRYRATGEGERSPGRLFGRRIYEYKLGPAVDASGSTAAGRSFSGFKEFQRILLEREDEIARNLIQQLIVFATGAEIQFADREEVDRLLEAARVEGYGLRGMILDIVQSRLFLEK